MHGGTNQPSTVNAFVKLGLKKFLLHLNDAFDHHVQDLYGHFRELNEQLLKAFPFPGETFDAGDRPHGEQSIDVRKKRKASEKIALLKFIQQHGMVREFTNDLHSSGNDNIAAVSKLTLAEDELPRRVGDPLPDIGIEFETV